MFAGAVRFDAMRRQRQEVQRVVRRPFKIIYASDVTAVDLTPAALLFYRNTGATKAVPGFDVIDHGQENYVFGNETEDARHWNVFLNDIFQNAEYADVLRELFDSEVQ